MDENVDAWDLWALMQTQWRSAGFGILGLDYGCLMKMASLLSITWTPGLIKKIQALESKTLTRANKPKR
jgi:hypothetical protein